jgi:hypothetical protein
MKNPAEAARPPLGVNHVFWNACKLMAKGASSTEKADLFGGAAARCYRLNVIG